MQPFNGRFILVCRLREHDIEIVSSRWSLLKKARLYCLPTNRVNIISNLIKERCSGITFKSDHWHKYLAAQGK